MITDRYVARVEIHKIVMASPDGISPIEIRAKLGRVAPNLVRRCLDWLVIQGNIVKTGASRGIICHPTDKPIMTIEAMKSMLNPKGIKRALPRPRENMPKEDKAAQPWRTVHNNPDRPPIKNQGAQGCIRRDARRGCSLS